MEPLVSVVCTVFNHQDYLEECLHGFVSQKANFKIEVLVNDDKSKDSSREIIAKYENKYPELFKCIYQQENQYSKGVDPWSDILFAKAKGKYIALCEGDDYWIDPYKLQKQVDFLEANPSFAMVFSGAETIIEDNLSSYRKINSFDNDRIFTGQEILDTWIVPTASVIFRTKYLKDNDYSKIKNEKFIYRDMPLFLYLSTKGKVYGFKDKMVAYRRHADGMSINSAIFDNFQKKYYTHLCEIINVFGSEFKTPIMNRQLSEISLDIAIKEFKQRKLLSSIYFSHKAVKHDFKKVMKGIVRKIKPQ